jgi:Protein of unknown function (DUF3592)
MIFRQEKRGFLKIIGGAALFLLALGYFLLAPSDMYTLWKAAKTWKETPAVVTAVEEVERKFVYVTLGPHLRVYYEYRVDGMRHKEFTRGGNLRHLGIGDNITVLVNPDKPAQSVFKRSEFLWSAWLGIVCILVGTWLAWKWLITSPHEKFGGTDRFGGI